jgi:hypothetical protein
MNTGMEHIRGIVTRVEMRRKKLVNILTYCRLFGRYGRVSRSGASNLPFNQLIG